MSIFQHQSAKHTSSSRRLFVVDRPIFPKTANAVEGATVATLVQELLDKNGVPLLKMSLGGQIIAKTLHLDPSGLFLIYSPTQQDLLDATVFIPHIHEFRTATDSFALRFADFDPATEANCFSLTLKFGAAWSFVFQTGTMALWRATIEVLVLRAREIMKQYPLKVMMIRLWPNIRYYDNRYRRKSKGKVVSGELVAKSKQARQQQQQPRHGSPLGRQQQQSPELDDDGHDSGGASSPFSSPTHGIDVAGSKKARASTVSIDGLRDMLNACAAPAASVAKCYQFFEGLMTFSPQAAAAVAAARQTAAEGEEEGEDGLRAFFAEVCEGTDRLIASLDAHGMLLRAPLDTESKIMRVFGAVPRG